MYKKIFPVFPRQISNIFNTNLLRTIQGTNIKVIQSDDSSNNTAMLQNFHDRHGGRKLAIPWVPHSLNQNPLGKMLQKKYTSKNKKADVFRSIGGLFFYEKQCVTIRVQYECFL